MKYLVLFSAAYHLAEKESRPKIDVSAEKAEHAQIDDFSIRHCPMLRL
jgi:hypothetical protein